MSRRHETHDDERERGDDEAGGRESGGRRGVKRGRHSDSDSDSDSDYESERVEKRARLFIEESLTEAVVRRCPSCRKAIIKGQGCCHVECVCGESLCFMCGRRWARCATRCRQKNFTLAKAARAACEKLRVRYPRLTFGQCQAIIGRKWTTEKAESGPDHDYDDD